MTVFETLNAVNVNEHTEKKKVDGKTELTYLSWPWAWAEVKKRYPDAHYEIKQFENGLPYTCDPSTGYMVFTSVTIEGITHDMWLPVMDGANNALKQSDYIYFVKNPYFKYAKKAQNGKYYDNYGKEQEEYIEKKAKAATMFDVNKTIMRCLVKNLAMFGLGLYIYAGEDLPEGEEGGQNETKPKMELTPASEPLPPWNPEDAIRSYCKRTGWKLAEFGKMREALITAGIVREIPAADLTKDQLDELVLAIEANFKDVKK